MRIAALNQFYWPDLAATSQLLTDVCEHWARQGHEVHVVCGATRYAGTHTFRPAQKVHNGVTIHRVWSLDLGRATLLHRSGEALSFHGAAMAQLCALPKLDVVVAKTSPPLISAVGWAAARVHGARFVYWVQDLYPNLAVALGAVSPRSPVTRVAQGTARHVLKKAHAVVALGATMKKVLIQQGAQPARVHVVHNWANGDCIVPRSALGHPLRQAWGVGSKKVVMYSGTLGLAHDAPTVMAGVQRLLQRQDLFLAWVGEGAHQRALREAVGQSAHARFMPLFPREQLGTSLTAADVHLISLHSNLAGLVVPSKLYGIFAAGRPSVYVGPRNSDVWNLLERHQAGLCVENGDVEGLYHAVVMLCTQPALRRLMGRNARAAHDQWYDPSHALRSWDAVLAA